MALELKSQRVVPEMRNCRKKREDPGALSEDMSKDGRKEMTLKAAAAGASAPYPELWSWAWPSGVAPIRVGHALGGGGTFVRQFPMAEGSPNKAEEPGRCCLG